MNPKAITAQKSAITPQSVKPITRDTQSAQSPDGTGTGTVMVVRYVAGTEREDEADVIVGGGVVGGRRGGRRLSEMEK